MLAIRRAVAIEARAGGASRERLGAKLANAIAANAELERTYRPVDIDAVLAVVPGRRSGAVERSTKDASEQIRGKRLNGPENASRTTRQD